MYNTDCYVSPMRNKSDCRVLKNSKGRAYETACDIICDSFKQIEVYHFYCVICGLGDT